MQEVYKIITLTFWMYDFPKPTKAVIENYSKYFQEKFDFALYQSSETSLDKIQTEFQEFKKNNSRLYNQWVYCIK